MIEAGSNDVGRGVVAMWGTSEVDMSPISET